MKAHEEVKKINGINITVKEAGSGQTMIFLHGRGYSKENMDPMFEHYRDAYHVVSYDARGHGESDKPKSFTLDDHVDDLAEIIANYNLGKPIVVGFSMGSYIALKTAEKYPNLFSKIVLIGTKGGGTTSSTEKVAKEGQLNGLSKAQMAQTMMQKIFAPQTTAEKIASFDKKIASKAVLTGTQQAAITNSLQDFDLITDANKVTIPVLVLTGEYDGLNQPVEGKKVADALPNARFETIPNAGHIAFFENPTKVYALIDTFVRNN
ncbi:Beta-ketoadipate enol-lactone hydrolase [Pediococcus damnosus]|uniref:alpha/beta fold hydrolase n=1 Tax=Pediococcus damnosus TaxID=51663 RepID=UPI00078C9A94|nr:alpha/beta hydrolase [Pediococcus damnosus]AMV68770.1 Beta-ketoadipate enol-lactone hydrolase [Pediococcus damnosus]